MRQALKPESRVVPQFQNPLHLRCGDDILGKLRQAGLPGKMMGR